MIRRRLWAWVAGIVGVTAAVLALNLAFGNTPALGLDLQGGLSVTLAPTEGATDDDLLVIRDLIRDELERRGIAEPDVRVEGPNIIVDLPGVRDQEDALDAVDVAGIVTLRPVYQCFAAAEPGASTTTPSGTAPGSTIAGTVPGSTTAGSAASPTTAAAGDHGAGNGLGSGGHTVGVRRLGPADRPAHHGEHGATDDDRSDHDDRARRDDDHRAGCDDDHRAGASTTVPPAQPETEVLPVLDGGQCLVGPPGGTGEVFSRGSAAADLDPQRGWVVNTTLTGTGNESWNALALQCNQGLETCPSRQLAIVLDNVIQSAPVVNEPNFPDDVQISGMESEGDARSLARVLNRGAFPVNVEAADGADGVADVGPGLAAGVGRSRVGRRGARPADVGVLLPPPHPGDRRGFGRLGDADLQCRRDRLPDDELRPDPRRRHRDHRLDRGHRRQLRRLLRATQGRGAPRAHDQELRRPRLQGDRGGRSSPPTWWRSSPSAVLFVLSVGSVRGFALYLGITTVCDLIVFFCFTRPAVALLASSGVLDRRDTFGLGVKPS